LDVIYLFNYLFIYLFNDAVSSSEFISSNGAMISEKRIGKCHGLISCTSRILHLPVSTEENRESNLIRIFGVLAEFRTEQSRMSDRSVTGSVDLLDFTDLNAESTEFIYRPPVTMSELSEVSLSLY
jgi:hypothetical protein